jgi:metal transporter CNNM
MLIKYFLIFYLFLINFINCEEQTSLRVIYLTPQDDNTIFNLNEKSTFGNDYANGWILPTTQKLTLNLYLYYDGIDVQSLIQIYNRINTSTYIKNTNSNQTSIGSGINIHPIKETLYMYFTTEKTNCDDYHTEQHIPLKFLSKLADNMYKAQIKVSLNYARTPYYICMQQIDADENIYDQNRHFHHQGTSYWLSIITTKDLMPLWSRLLVFIVLLSLSGLFSGLNLGLMSLDVSELVLLKEIGTDKERTYAKMIYPLRKRGNFLLCTILLGNVLVNSTSTLILGDLLSGIYAAFGSTILIVLFGEIIPQAACSKHGLAVGAYTRYITYFFMGLTSPVSYPLSKILDFVLGKEIAATYNRDKIRELMKNVKDLEENERKIISGVLDFNQRKVKEIMTPLDKVFMLDVNSKLDFETIVKIQQKGFSRIPVYESTIDNVVGLLHFKDFTLLDPDDNMPVLALLEHYNHKVEFCETDDNLGKMFERFCLGEAHLAFVTELISEDEKDPYQKCVGIVTLEDVIEELVQEEIYDEFDEKESKKIFFFFFLI